jgi:hypothetical protein
MNAMRSPFPTTSGFNSAQAQSAQSVYVLPTGADRPYLLSVRKTAEYIGRTEKAVRHLYERRILTPLRIDGRVFIDRREIDVKYEKARMEAY